MLKGLQKSGMNKWLLLATLLLICFGTVVVYTASTAHALQKGLPPEYYLTSHLQKVGIALVLMLIASKVDYGVWKKGSRVVFCVGIVMTIWAIVGGEAVNGAHRWIHGIQPSEILKLGLIAMVCAKLSAAGTEIKSLKCSIIQPAIPFVISAILLALQPNYSMLLLFAGILLAVLLVAGARFKFIAMSIGACIPVVAVALLVKAHTSMRIQAFLHPEKFHESSHQVEHALQALGNGGWTGTGIGMGMQKLGYLPEAHKDVVYAVVGEEFGFMGTFFVLALFAILFYQGFEIARHSSTRFGKYLAVALTVSLFLNFLIHVCVSTGLFPTTGQPLPFLSFGGTNLIFSALFIGILLNISRADAGKKIWEPYMNSADGVESHSYEGFDYSRSEI